MINKGDIKDLYNTQDIILLCEIIKNRFYSMYDRYGFNHRICNSASSLSGNMRKRFIRSNNCAFNYQCF